MDISSEDFQTPHRGSLILGLGLSSVISAVVLCMCCSALGVVSLGLGIAAWVMGARDLKAMASGAMDPRGHSSTQGGMVCGIIGAILGFLGLLMTLVMVLFYAGAAAGPWWEQLNR